MSVDGAAFVFYGWTPICVIFGMWLGGRIQRMDDADQSISEAPHEAWRVAVLRAKIRVEEEE